MIETAGKTEDSDKIKTCSTFFTDIAVLLCDKKISVS